MRSHCVSAGLQHFNNAVDVFPRASRKQTLKIVSGKHFDLFWLQFQNENDLIEVQSKIFSFSFI